MIAQDTREAQIERRVQGAKNIEKFWSCVKEGNSKYTIFVSYPRSGKEWTRQLLNVVGGKVVAQFPHGIGGGNYEDYWYFNEHTVQDDVLGECKSDLIKENNLKVMLLLRDPRDVALSRAYWSTRWAWTDYTVVTPETVEERVVYTSNHWMASIQAVLNLNPMAVIRYEQLCLYPVETLTEILRCLDNPPRKVSIEEAIREEDRIKNHSVENGELAMELRPQVFNDGLARYKRHCLKWQRDELFTKEHSDIIWNTCRGMMLRFGYTKDGHVSTENFRCS